MKFYSVVLKTLHTSIFRHHVKKPHGRVWVKLHTFLNMALNGSEWPALCSSCSTAKDRVPGNLWLGGWVGFTARVGVGAKRQFPALTRYQTSNSSQYDGTCVYINRSWKHLWKWQKINPKWCLTRPVQIICANKESTQRIINPLIRVMWTWTVSSVASEYTCMFFLNQYNISLH
jgi:hypothetical protein